VKTGCKSGLRNLSQELMALSVRLSFQYVGNFCLVQYILKGYLWVPQCKGTGGVGYAVYEERWECVACLPASFLCSGFGK
jgi:hypothetical protein